MVDVVVIEDCDKWRDTWVTKLNNLCAQGVHITRWQVVANPDQLSREFFVDLLARIPLVILDDHLWGSWSGNDIAKALCALGYPRERILIASMDDVGGFLNYGKPNDVVFAHNSNKDLILFAFVNEKIRCEQQGRDVQYWVRVAGQKFNLSRFTLYADELLQELKSEMRATVS